MTANRLERLQEALRWFGAAPADLALCGSTRPDWGFGTNVVSGYEHGVMLWKPITAKTVELWWLGKVTKREEDHQLFVEKFTKVVVVNHIKGVIEDATADILLSMGVDLQVLYRWMAFAGERAVSDTVSRLESCYALEHVAKARLLDEQLRFADPIEHIFDVLDGLPSGTKIQIELIFNDGKQSKEELDQKQVWWNEARAGIQELRNAGRVTLVKDLGHKLSSYPPSGAECIIRLKKDFDPREFVEKVGRGIHAVSIV